MMVPKQHGVETADFFLLFLKSTRGFFWYFFFFFLLYSLFFLIGLQVHIMSEWPV